ncbi:MAG: repeat containing protein [Bryobacterales bacterium]|nr:repeat containing protein [Bryobacterales bacterium]
MKRIFNVVFCAAATAAAIYAQPVIGTGGIVNAASYAYSGLPNSGIAQGSLFLVFGSGLGPSTLDLASVPLSSSFGGTSLTVTVNGVTTQPVIAYTSAGQVEAVLPSSAPAGSGILTVTYNGQTSATAPIQVVTSSFGIFAVNQAGSGPGIITNASYSIAGLSTAANPGQTYIIWGTGLGPIVSGSDANGGGTLGSIPVQVLVGGSTAAVSGYARSSCCGGLDQIAFVVPTAVTGCRVPVAVQIGNVVSNFVSMPIAASGSVCSDPANPTVTPVTGSGNVSIGNINLTRSTISLPLPPPLGLTNSTIDTGSGSFYRYNPAQYAAQSNPLQIATFGSCTVFTFKGSNQTYVDPVQPVALDAGPSISVTGPNGTKTLTKTSGLYSAQLGGGIAGVPGQSPLYLSPGQYQINNGTGGADVGSFSLTLNVPAPLVWTNASSTTTVNRTAGQNVAWTGGDPGGNV